MGVDGCKGAWVAAVVAAGEITWRHGRFADLLDGDLEVVAVDMAIGLAEHGRRGADVSAKAAMGAAAARVFALPARAGFEPEVDSQAQANILLRSLGEPGVSAQAWALRAAVAEVAAHAWDPRLIEVHPELSFKAMTGHVLESKKTARGVAQRLRALAGWIDALGAMDRAPHRVPVDDCLDALAAAWSAQRVAAGTAAAYPPADAGLDRSGRAMVIYA